MFWGAVRFGVRAELGMLPVGGGHRNGPGRPTRTPATRAARCRNATPASQSPRRDDGERLSLARRLWLAGVTSAPFLAPRVFIREQSPPSKSGLLFRGPSLSPAPGRLTWIWGSPRCSSEARKGARDWVKCGLQDSAPCQSLSVPTPGDSAPVWDGRPAADMRSPVRALSEHQREEGAGPASRQGSPGPARGPMSWRRPPPGSARVPWAGPPGSWWVGAADGLVCSQHARLLTESLGKLVLSLREQERRRQWISQAGGEGDGVILGPAAQHA